MGKIAKASGNGHVNRIKGKAEAVEDDINIALFHGNESMKAKYKNIRAFLTIVTPEIAAFWLCKNSKNRKLNEMHSRHLQDVLKADHFVLNGETIVISDEGHVLDGQHRLTACVQTGISFESLVVIGIPSKRFDTLDAGRTRTAAEAIGISGEVNCRAVSAAVQQFVTFLDRGGSTRSNTEHSRKVTASLIHEVLRVHPGIRASVLAMNNGNLFRNGQSMALHYLFSTVSVSKACEFADVMENGSDDRGRPFNVLRENIIRMDPDARRTIGVKCVKAFNAEMTGLRPKILKVSRMEAFPAINGLELERLQRSIASPCSVDPADGIEGDTLDAFRWIESRGGYATVRDIAHGMRRFRNDTAKAEQAARWLVAEGLAEWSVSTPSEAGGRPRDGIKLLAR